MTVCKRLLLVFFTLGRAGLCFGQLADDFNPGADSDVYALAVQMDGKIIAGGEFRTLAGESRSFFGRLTSNGTLDPTLTNLFVGGVYAVAVQEDGRLLLGASSGLLRFNANGSFDSDFKPAIQGDVECVAVQADGKILVGGHFFSISGQPRNNIGRLNPDGTLDTGFNPGATGPSYTYVNSLVIQPNGDVLVGGGFTALGGLARTNLGRLKSDGTIDTNFNPNPGAGTFNSGVGSVVVQADGNILVGGWFGSVAGHSASNIARLHLDGTFDDSFNASADKPVNSIALQTDGKMVVSGAFTNLSGSVRTYLGRLNANGSVDMGFDPPATGGSPYSPLDSPRIFGVALQPDGKILVGGYFTNLTGLLRTNIGRISNTEPATQTLTFDGSSVMWLRSGTSPEISGVKFNASTNGLDWFALDSVARVSGGWRASGVGLPTNATIRGVGFQTGGYGNGSSWPVEAVTGPPAIAQGPQSRTNNASTTAMFSVRAVGSGELTYQWLKNGAAVVDGGNVLGSRTSSLIVSNVLGADMGNYSVVVTSPLGSVMTLIAGLSVIDPYITSAPTNLYANLGQTMQFSVAVAGSAPVNYQWRKGGVILPGETGPSLTLTNVQGADAGSYDVIVSNAFGSRTTSAAFLTVNLATRDQWTGFEYVNCLALRTNGQVFVSGLFSSFPGTPPNYFARLTANGNVDYNFWSESDNCIASSILIRADGSLLIGGTTTTGSSIESIRRLSADGAWDRTFNAGAAYNATCLLEQTNGQIVVGGSVSKLGGQACENLGRINSDGSLDASFHPTANDAVWTMALQPDGKIIVGGKFTRLSGQERSLIGRLLPDGSVDASFNPGAIGDAVHSLAVQPDGKILVGGSFGRLAGQPRTGLGRLNPDGSLDTSFNPTLGGSTPQVWCTLLQANGEIILGGWFASINGLARTNIAKIAYDGTVDLTFNPGPSSSLSTGGYYCLGLQADGRLLVGGDARLRNPVAATQSLSVDGGGVTWLRGGSSPEAWRTTFEASTNGVNWISLGAGERIAGGWRWTGAVAKGEFVRARGYVTGSIGNRSTWYVESKMQVGEVAPVIVVNDGSLGFAANGFGFKVAALAGQAVVIERSIDLLNWAPLGTNFVSSSPIAVSDAEAGYVGQRFYRARPK
jgi:uncharacterized delta-60 repeat protein